VKLSTSGLKVGIDIEPWLSMWLGTKIIDWEFKWAPIGVAILSEPGFDATTTVDNFL